MTDPAHLFDLSGRDACVTGARSGLGRRAAIVLAAAGAKVIGVARRADALADLATVVGSAFSAVAADIAERDKLSELASAIAKPFGAPDIVVHAAGINTREVADDVTPKGWDTTLALNLTAPFFLSQALVPAMKAKGWGRIINTGSMHSLVASPFKSAYNAAKHGLAGFTKTVALEVATQGITVNNICPGYVWTSLVENQIPDTMKARGLTRDQVINDVLLANQPQKKFVQVEQLAALAVFLCREEASAITGTNLSVDGGWTAQ